MYRFIKSLKKMRCRLLVWSTHSVALPIIRMAGNLPRFPYSITALRAMPDGTLGNALMQFLDSQGLVLLPQYESHDIKHVLLGYGADEEGEAAMQYFFLGNGARSFPVIITVLVTLIIMPEFYSSFRRAYIRGRHTPPLAGTDWHALVHVPVADIHNLLQISSLNNPIS